MKQAACGGTGCAVLNGESLLPAVHGAAVGGLAGEGLAPLDSQAADRRPKKGMRLGES